MSDHRLEKGMHLKDSRRFATLSNHSEISRRYKRRAQKRQAGNASASTETDMSVKEVKGALSAKKCETPPKKDQRNCRDQEMHTVNSTIGSTEGDNSSKRKRGRPKLLLGSGARSSMRKTVMNNSCVGDEAETSAEDCMMRTTVDKPNNDHFQPSSKDSTKGTADNERTSGIYRHNDLLSEIAIISLPEHQEVETSLSKRGKRHKNSLSSEHEQMRNIVDSESRYQGMLIDGILADINNDQVCNSRFHLDKPSPTGSDDSRSLSVQHQCANAFAKQDNFGTPLVAEMDKMGPSPLQKTDGPNLGDLPVKSLGHTDSSDKGGELKTPSASVCIDDVENNQSLPFVKDSPLWKILESMEIFKKAAKKPHFSPLVKCTEETREGLAIGHMVNFSNLVENISKLQFHHPISVIESKIETLAELESHGFKVETLRACLTQLLSKKQREDEIQKENKDIGNDISNSVEEISKANEEINKLKQKFKEVAVKLGKTLLRKEMKEIVISTLKSKQDVVGENVQRLHIDFKNIVGSLW